MIPYILQLGQNINQENDKIQIDKITKVTNAKRHDTNETKTKRQIANMTKYKRTKTQMLQHTKRQKNMTNYNQVPLRQRKWQNTKSQNVNVTECKKAEYKYEKMQ